MDGLSSRTARPGDSGGIGSPASPIIGDEGVGVRELSARLPLRSVRMYLAYLAQESEGANPQPVLRRSDESGLASGASRPAAVAGRSTLSIVIVLLTYRDDVAGGLEHGVAALAAGLRRLGHRVVIVTAVAGGGDGHLLGSLRLSLPTTQQELRMRLRSPAPIQAELRSLLRGLEADLVCYADPVRGLGMVAPTTPGVRSVLMVHAGNGAEELALARGRSIDVVVATSAAAVRDARAAGVEVDDEAVVSWGLLPSLVAVPSPSRRSRLRAAAPVRIVTRLDPDKGIAVLTGVPSGFPRGVEVALACGAVEEHPGEQRATFDAARRVVRGDRRVRLRRPLGWGQVPGFLAGASVAVVAAGEHTFGSVALEAMRVGTPVVGVAAGNLPELVGPAGVLVSPSPRTAAEVWEAAASLLDAGGGLRYEVRSTAGIARAAGYACDRVAARWLAAAGR